jgi:hypothetical protein
MSLSEPDQQAESRARPTVRLARTEGTGAVGNLDDIRAKRATNGFSIPLLDAQGVHGLSAIRSAAVVDSGEQEIRSDEPV